MGNRAVRRGEGPDKYPTALNVGDVVNAIILKTVIIRPQCGTSRVAEIASINVSEIPVQA
jgi:hypothetical protein